MSPQHIFLVIFTTLLVTATSTAMENPKPIAHRKEAKLIVAVEGMVYCQSCQQEGAWSLAGAKTLPGAMVGVSCKDHKNRVSFYKAVQTNNNGYFYALLHLSSTKSYYQDYQKEACTARLLSSPDPECNHLTNINYGIEGSKIRDENRRVTGKGYMGVVYAAGPMAFRTAYCPLEFQYY